MKFCENCGTKLEDKAVFCEECGAKQEVIGQVSENDENKVVETKNVSIQKVETTPVSVSKTSETTNESKNIEDVKRESGTPKLSETCISAKREMETWAAILMLIVCSPWIATEFAILLPDYVDIITYFVMQIAALGMMWTRCNWNKAIKILVIIIYIVMNFI